MAESSNIIIGSGEKLKEHIESKLSYADYIAMNKKLGLSPHMRTKFLNHPEKMPLTTVMALAELLNSTVKQLLDDYGCGAETLTENEKLLLNQENKAVA